VTYTDVTLSPDDIEWDQHRANVWGAANDPEEFDLFLDQRGIVPAIEYFYKAHRKIANRLIVAGVTQGDEFPEAREWIYAARVFKSARTKAAHRYRALHGDAATLELQRSLREKYPKPE